MPASRGTAYFPSLPLQAIMHRAAREIFSKKENQIILLPLTSTFWCLLQIIGLKSGVLIISLGPYLIWPLPSSSAPSSVSHLLTVLWSHCLFLLFEYPYLISSPVALCFLFLPCQEFFFPKSCRAYSLISFLSLPDNNLTERASLTSYSPPVLYLSPSFFAFMELCILACQSISCLFFL